MEISSPSHLAISYYYLLLLLLSYAMLCILSSIKLYFNFLKMMLINRVIVHQYQYGIGLFCPSSAIMSTRTSASTTLEMDKIRARSLLKNTYIYNPSSNIAETVLNMAKQCGFNLETNEWKAEEITGMDKKETLLIELGRTLKHSVPNSKLHKMKTFGDLLEFYSQPVTNITKYAQMARDDRLPKNLAIKEHPRRFHPNDKSALHGGVTATPGEGGKILGIRNKRLYRQYKPKKNWYDYEDQTFNIDVSLSKGMPWDPEVAHKMDTHADIRFTINRLKNMNK